jgi:hypothetical protein
VSGEERELEVSLVSSSPDNLVNPFPITER